MAPSKQPNLSNCLIIPSLFFSLYRGHMFSKRHHLMLNWIWLSKVSLGSGTLTFQTRNLLYTVYIHRHANNEFSNAVNSSFKLSSCCAHVVYSVMTTLSSALFDVSFVNFPDKVSAALFPFKVHAIESQQQCIKSLTAQLTLRLICAIKSL